MKSYYEILINKQPLEEKIVAEQNNFTGESKPNGEIIVNKVNGQDSETAGYSVRYRVNLKHTIKGGYVPEFTVEASGNIQLEEFTPKLLALQVWLQKEYPDMPRIEKKDEGNNGITIDDLY